jgi:hypothetical protein
MRPRFLFAVPVLLVVWLASGNGGGGGGRPLDGGSRAGQAAGAPARYDPSQTPTTQPDFLRAAAAAAQSDPTKTPTAPPEVAREEVAPKTAREQGASPTSPDAQFASTVRPILVTHCAPCHEPGGRMYERLPFDRAETIASHREGVLKRIKVPDEKAAIEKWLASL